MSVPYSISGTACWCVVFLSSGLAVVEERVPLPLVSQSHSRTRHCYITQVVDLTELVMSNRGPLADPLIAAAGTDVSHWFSPASSPPAGDGKKPRSGKKGGNAGSRSKTANGGDGSRPEDEHILGDPRTFVDPHTGLTVPYLPMGRCRQCTVNYSFEEEASLT